MFKNDNVDILITDQMVDSDKLSERLKNSNLFNNVFHVTIKEYIPKGKFKFILSFIKSELFPNNLLKKLKIQRNEYDYFFTYNVDLFAESIFYNLSKQNENIKVCLYDEGVSTYTSKYESQLYSNKLNILRKFIKGLKIRNYISDYANDLYLLDPDLICWKFPGEIHKIQIPDSDSDDINFKIILNKIYGIEELNDNYKEKIIFFEESYFWDNKPINDMELVNRIASRVGKDNISIKLHPRNRINRFDKIGYKTNTQVGIPWEVIVMNMDINSKKIFITVSSGSVLSYKLLFGKSFKTFMLFNCLSKNDTKIYKGYILYFEKFKEKYNENLYIPDNLESLDTLLKEECK